MEQVGFLWNWQRGDTLAPLAPPAANWRVRAFRTGDANGSFGVLPGAQFDLSSQRSQRRFALGHHLHIGFLGAKPVASGWAAHGLARAGSPPVSFTTPPGVTYLFDFETQPEWRGLGCYPALLQAIIATDPASDFWIIHHITNNASQRGIAHAGFQLAATVHRAGADSLALLPGADIERAAAGAALLGLPLLSPR